MNTWPDGIRRAIHQTEHEKWNSKNYPGTLQLCSICEEPTGRCEEDAIWSDDAKPLCEICYNSIKKDEA